MNGKFCAGCVGRKLPEAMSVSEPRAAGLTENCRPKKQIFDFFCEFFVKFLLLRPLIIIETF